MYLTYSTIPHRIIGAFLVFQRREFANILIPTSLCYTIVRAFHVFRVYLFPRGYAILTQSFALSMYSEFTKISCMYCNYRIVRAFSVSYSAGPASPSRVGEMRSNGTFLFSQLFVCRANMLDCPAPPSAVFVWGRCGQMGQQSFALSMYSEFIYSNVIMRYLHNRSRFPCIPSSRK